MTGIIKGTLNYGSRDPVPDRDPNYWRSKGRICRYPGCGTPITDKAKYCMEHRDAGMKVQALVDRLLDRARGLG